MPRSGTLPGRADLGRRPRRRLRVVLRRQPVAFWAFVVLTAATAWWTTHAATARIEAGADAYGELVDVLVTTRDVPPGAPITVDDHRTVALPADLVPADAVSDLPADTTARDRLVAGEAIAASRLAPQGVVGTAARLSPGERAVAVPLDGHTLDLSEGQVVDVLATGDPTTAAGRPSRVVAREARVVAVSETGITVAVDEDAALDIATALAATVVTVTLTPG